MASEYMPNLIVSVDSDSDELSDEEGRENFEEMYLKRKEAGKPWIIPEGMVNVQQIKPLTLNDLAINDAVTLDKRRWQVFSEYLLSYWELELITKMNSIIS